MNKGKLFIISAPSGTGKTTLLQKVMAEVASLQFSVSHTTRQPREGECNGREYHFVDRQEFSRMQEENLFLEWAQVHDNYYGTSLEEIDRRLASGVDIILDIDVQGADIIREAKSVDAAFIFICPPSLAELKKRLERRATDSEESIRVRLHNAEEEMQSVGRYEYVVVNDAIDQAAHTLQSIIIAERARMRRLPSGQSIKL